LIMFPHCSLVSLLVSRSREQCGNIIKPAHMQLTYLYHLPAEDGPLLMHWMDELIKARGVPRPASSMTLTAYQTAVRRPITCPTVPSVETFVPTPATSKIMALLSLFVEGCQQSRTACITFCAELSLAQKVILYDSCNRSMAHECSAHWLASGTLRPRQVGSSPPTQ